MPSEQATHSLQQSVRHTNIIAHHEARACREVSRLSESVAVGFLAVNGPWRCGPDIRRGASHFLGIETPARSDVGSASSQFTASQKYVPKLSRHLWRKCCIMRRLGMSTATVSFRRRLHTRRKQHHGVIPDLTAEPIES